MKISRLTLSVIFLALLSSGCASRNLFEQKEYKKEVVKNSHVFFTQTWALEEDGKFIVKGEIRKKTPSGRVPKLVRIDLVGPDGTAIDGRKVPYFPRIMSSRKRRKTARFAAEFAVVPPVGTSVRLSLTD